MELSWRKNVTGGELWSYIAQSHFLFFLCFQTRCNTIWSASFMPPSAPWPPMACLPTERKAGINHFLFKVLWSGILLQQHVKSLIKGATGQGIQRFLLQLYRSVLGLFASYCWDKMPWTKTASGSRKKENGYSFRRHRVYPGGQGVAAGAWDWPGSQEV